MPEETITYERLFDILREERTNVKLQQLPLNFYASVSEYISFKTSSGVEQLKNAKRIVEEIYQRREKKILNLALSKSRTKSNLIDTSALLPEEKLYFKQTVILLDHFRDDIITEVLEGTHVTEMPKEIKTVEEDGTAYVEHESTAKEISEKESEAVTPRDSVRIKVLSYIDKFVGPDLEIMGPYDEDDIVQVSSDIADLLISKELAEKFGE